MTLYPGSRAWGREGGTEEREKDGKAEDGTESEGGIAVACWILDSKMTTLYVQNGKDFNCLGDSIMYKKRSVTTLSLSLSLIHMR